MTKQIFENRWFIWTLAAIVITGLSVWGFVEYSNVKMNNESAESEVVLHRSPSSMQNDILDWQTYRSERYGFELKYFPSWIITKDPEEYEVSVSSGNCFLKIGPFGRGISFDWTIEEKEITIDSQKYTQSIVKDEKGKTMEIAINTPTNDGILLRGVSDQNCLDNLNQILSTFKFIE